MSEQRAPDQVDETAWALADTVVWQMSRDDADEESPERLYVMDLETGVPVVLDGSSALIWTALTGLLEPNSPADGHPPVTTEAITREAAQAVGLAPEQIRSDVAAFLQQLSAQGLVRPVS